MFSAAATALGDIASPALRSVLWKALGLTVVLFVGLLVTLEVALSWFASFPWPWLSTVLAVVTGFGLFAGFIFLLAPVTAMFAGLFLDEIADLVEARHYPQEAPGRPLATLMALWTGIEFAVLVLIVNLALLPAFFFGIGAVMMWLGNAYLLGREYFGLVATRHLPASDAARLRKAHAGSVFVAGLIPAGVALVPLVNFITPLFATAYFVHVYRLLRDGRTAL